MNRHQEKWYTPAGSLASVTEGNATTTYTYDALGGLRQVVKSNGDEFQYIVDGAGRRVWKLHNGTRVQGFVYADALRPVAELDGAGNIVARFIYGRHVNVPDLMIKNNTTYRIVTDHLGSPRFVVDMATGAIAQTMTYDEFGRVLSDSAPGFQPFGFAGGIFDRDTGLVRFGARDYDAFTGRWTAKDPILWAGGQGNLYAYVGNDPVNRGDAIGLVGWSETANPVGAQIDPANWLGASAIFWSGVASLFTDGQTRFDTKNGRPIVVLENNFLMRLVDNDGLTLGHVVLLNSTRAADPETYAHELQHVTQHDFMGPLYLPAHINAQLFSYLTSGDVNTNNPLEWGPWTKPPCAFTTSSPW